MPGEQPPKTICEICGGIHATSAHVQIEKNAQEEESAHEREPHHEAMEKVVDLFATEDLRYRALTLMGGVKESILYNLEVGIITPLTAYVREPFGKVDKTAREKQKELQLNREREREKSEHGMGGDYSFFRNKANVFYPEGLIKALRDKLVGTSDIEIYGKSKKPDEYQEYGSIMSGGMLQLIRAYFSLSQEERETMADLISSSENQISSSFKDWLESTKKSDVLIEPLVKKLLSEPQTWIKLRTAWLEVFFRARTNKEEEKLRMWGPFIRDPVQNITFEVKNVDPAYVVSRLDSLVFGLILSPDTKVALSPHQDFPEQATIMEPRVRPRNIIGIVVREDYLDKMRKETFNPPDPLLYLVDKFPRPFFDFLTNHGVEDQTSKMLLERFEQLMNQRFNWNLRDDNGKELGPYDRHIEHPLVARAIRNGLHFSSTGQNLKILDELAKKFIDEKSPIKDGETLWTGIVRLAEQHQLPIYNLRSELLWPKHLPHEQVAEFVAKKSEKK